MNPIASQNLLQNGEKREVIKEIITSIDTSKDLSFDRIKHIFDLIDNESIEDFNTAPFENVNIERSGLKGLNNRRSEIEILAVILRVAWNSTKKTELLHKANLSGRQLKKFLKFLIKSGFIMESPTSKRASSFKTTPKGTLFLLHWTKILYLLEV